jgi:hypothetical protein
MIFDILIRISDGIYVIGVLGQLGRLVTVEERDGGSEILRRSCPRATALERQPRSCLLAEALPGDIVDVFVRQSYDAKLPG